MTELIGLLFFVIIAALLGGQIKVVHSALRHGKAGIGRYTYKLVEQPTGFWLMLILEASGLILVALYVLAVLGVIAG